ncbi:Signal recognition particle protein [Coemansia spiralis]|uniref:Signal recognition particle protein n=2 Tax=Coemansia TaxID=4863 RepID=A0A9W8L0Q7_9FUNG|nr:Signal recognition particle protein [Coemansia umbellata]KAJ2623169.1 Signal recognition particle protein [Coemansia sp. RSA 1358]KAJ2680047.1 Signal recognition particle protein [Coemansia spiralis]
MVFYSSWGSFEKAATDIYAGAADKARYTIKYRNSDGVLILKVTDDATCAQMRTEKLDDIKRIANLHRILAQTASRRSQAIKMLPPAFPKAKGDSNDSVAAAKGAKGAKGNASSGGGSDKKPHKSGNTVHGKKTRGKRKN